MLFFASFSTYPISVDPGLYEGHYKEQLSPLYLKSARARERRMVTTTLCVRNESANDGRTKEKKRTYSTFFLFFLFILRRYVAMRPDASERRTTPAIAVANFVCPPLNMLSIAHMSVTTSATDRPAPTVTLARRPHGAAATRPTATTSRAGRNQTTDASSEEREGKEEIQTSTAKVGSVEERSKEERASPILRPSDGDKEERGDETGEKEKERRLSRTETMRGRKAGCAE